MASSYLLIYFCDYWGIWVFRCIEVSFLPLYSVESLCRPLSQLRSCACGTMSTDHSCKSVSTDEVQTLIKYDQNLRTGRVMVWPAVGRFLPLTLCRWKGVEALWVLSPSPVGSICMPLFRFPLNSSEHMHLQHNTALVCKLIFVKPFPFSTSSSCVYHCPYWVLHPASIQSKYRALLALSSTLSSRFIFGNEMIALRNNVTGLYR